MISAVEDYQTATYARVMVLNPLSDALSKVGAAVEGTLRWLFLLCSQIKAYRCVLDDVVGYAMPRDREEANVGASSVDLRRHPTFGADPPP